MLQNSGIYTDNKVVKFVYVVRARSSKMWQLSQPSMRMKLEIHVEIKNGMWCLMPYELSDAILEQWHNRAQKVPFSWYSKEIRSGSYRPDGAETSINRYIIDFSTMRQRNLDNNRTRRVKIVAVLCDDRHCAK